MSRLDNLTPFAATTLPSAAFDRTQLLVAVVAGRFTLPAPGQQHDPRIADEQQPVPLSDVYWGEPGASSLRMEGQGTHLRHGTDIYISGHAWAPGGRACERALVGVNVGPCERRVLVLGARHWRPGPLGARPSAPRPFSKLPLVYERCFGSSRSELNPVGCGAFERERDALGQPLPNFEHPDALITTLRDRPAPAGLGPIPRNWRPRRDYGGTYDARWCETRAPLWPDDVDPRIMSAAAPGLVAREGLRGGEPVRLVGLHPDGALQFCLPELRLQAKFLGRAPARRVLMDLDGVHLEPDTGALTLYWRAAASVREQLFEIERVVVRALNEWESPP